MILRLVQPPAKEPVSLEEAKNHLRVDLSDDDTLIHSLIVSARQMAENYARRAFITQTWELTFFQSKQFVGLPREPIQEVLSVDSKGQSLSYEAEGSRIRFFSPVSGPVRIRYVAGYGDEPEDVPEAIRQAILQMVGHLYENRESQTMPSLGFQLLEPYKVWAV